MLGLASHPGDLMREHLPEIVIALSFLLILALVGVFGYFLVGTLLLDDHPESIIYSEG